MYPRQWTVTVTDVIHDSTTEKGYFYRATQFRVLTVGWISVQKVFFLFVHFILRVSLHPCTIL
jgi:hypothetical protein